jgi:hypothetical protein
LRRVDHVRDESASPPIATILARLLRRVCDSANRASGPGRFQPVRRFPAGYARHEAEAVLQNPPDLDSARGRELCDRFRQWYAETLNLPGVFYLQVVKWLFKENQIAERRFVALGQQVDLTQLRAPIFLLAASDDEVVSVDQLFATTRLHSEVSVHFLHAAHDFRVFGCQFQGSRSSRRLIG